MHRWMARGLLFSSVLSISVVAMASARAAATVASAPTALSGVNSAKGETSLGDWVADALRQTAKADVALLPANMLEEKELPANGATPEAIRKLIAAPPTEAVMVVKVTGKNLRKALNRSLSLFPKKNRGFLQVSGLNLTFDPSRDEEGRVLDVKVGDEALKDEKIYTVAMPESLARGGLGYINLWDVKDAKPINDDPKGPKLTLIDTVTARLKGGKIAFAADGRIKVKS